MPSIARERDEFITEATRAGLDMQTIRALLRHATTLQRLAVAQCNGDWPADNGERKVIFCGRCESGFVPSSFRWSNARNEADQRYKVCPDCRTAELVTALLEGTGFKAEFQGDPRGAVLRLHPVLAAHDDIESGRSRGIYVPPGRR